MHRVELVAGAGDHLGAVEEPAVEPLDALVAEEAAGLAVRHQPEQLGEAARELVGVGAARLDHAGDDAPREQPGVLGEEAEDDAVEVVGDGLRVIAAIAHRAGDRGEADGGRLGDLVGRPLRSQLLGVEHDGAEHAQRLGRALVARCEDVEGDAMDLRAGAREVGVDLDQVHIADDERGRVLEVLAVVEQLAVGGGEVGVRALVLPAKAAALPDVGPALAAGAGAFRAGLESVGLAAGIALVGRRHVEQAAKVDEVLLRGGPLAARVVAPLRGEVGGGQGWRRRGHARSSRGLQRQTSCAPFSASRTPSSVGG